MSDDRPSTAFRISRDLLDRLDAAATERTVSRNWLVERLLEEGVGRLHRRRDMTDPFKTSGYVHVSPPLELDSDALEAEFQRGMRRTFTPWEFPDRNPFPIIDPVPTCTSLVARTGVMAERVRSAWRHLRHGDCNHNHEW